MDGVTQTTFTITEDHIKLLRSCYVGWDSCEYGAPEIDCKRPYGNSGSTQIENDIGKILGWPLNGNDGYDKCLSSSQRDRARMLHQELETVLQIILTNCPEMDGKYVQTEKYNDRSWRPL